MTRYALALTVVAVVSASGAHAGPFSGGIGSAMIYGPYTGGHSYSYNTAYSYGFAFSSADTWRRDLFAYPAGIYPYRPYGRPIYHRAWPKTDTPPISVPGEDGLPVLVHPGAAAVSGPDAVAHLQPVPAQVAAERPARILVRVPQSAEVWFDQQKTAQSGDDRVFETPPVAAGKTLIYTVRAKWTEAGRAVEQFRIVGVKAGETAKLTFGPGQP
jgi:uncharacterized protein (TIGR03000 family)